MTSTPAPVPTSGLYDNHDAEIISIAVVFAVVSLVTVIARIAARRLKNVRLAIDDWLIVAAWIPATAQSILFAWTAKYGGAGHHIATLTPDQIVLFEKAFYTSSLIQPTTLMLCKISVLILLYRIFIIPKFRITVWILGAIVMMWWLGNFFASAFICFPVSSLWNPTVPGHCGNQVLLDLITPIPWILTDFAILIAPMPVIKHLQLSTRQKIGITAFFLIGGATCAVSVIKYHYFFYPLDDVTWDIVGAADWNMIELHVTIMCAAILACRPIAVRLAPVRLLSSIRMKLKHYASRLTSVSHRSGVAVETSATPASTLPRTADRAPPSTLQHKSSEDSNLEKKELGMNLSDGSGSSGRLGLLHSKSSRDTAGTAERDDSPPADLEKALPARPPVMQSGTFYTSGEWD